MEEEVVKKAASDAVTVLNLLKKEVYPVITQVAKSMGSILNKLSVAEDEVVVSVLQSKLTSCKELTENMLTSAKWYIECVEKCLHYASLREEETLEMKELFGDEIGGTKYHIIVSSGEPLGVVQLSGFFVLVGVIITFLFSGPFPIEFTIAGGSIGLATAVAPPMLKYCKRSRKLQSYLRNLTEHGKITAESYKSFEAGCGKIKVECYEALQLCKEAEKSVRDKKKRARLAGGTVGTVGAAIGVGGVAVVAAGFATFATFGLATPVLIGLGVGGAAAAVAGGGTAIGAGVTTFSFSKHCKKLIKELEDIHKKVETLEKKVRKCGEQMNYINLKLNSVWQDKEFVDRHVATKDSYYSFVKVWGQMMCSVKHAQETLQNTT